MIILLIVHQTFQGVFAMTSLSYQQLHEVLVPLILAAGQVVLSHYGQKVEVSSKADDSPVTKADQQAEAVILAELAKNWPAVPVIAEEQMAAGIQPKVGRLFFLVDPLDGTKEFVAARGEFTVNIALVEDGVPVYGLVLAPALGDLYITLDRRAAGHAALAPGARFRFDEIDFQTIQMRPWPVHGAAAVVSRSHPDEATSAFLDRHGIEARLPSGSSLKFCQLAAGRADVYPRFGPTMEWDTAAGDAVLRAAGGVLRAVDGGCFSYGKAGQNYKNGGFIACHADAVQLIDFTQQ